MIEPTIGEVKCETPGPRPFLEKQRDYLKALRDQKAAKNLTPSKELNQDIIAYEQILEKNAAEQYLEWREKNIAAGFTSRPRHYVMMVGLN